MKSKTSFDEIDKKGEFKRTESKFRRFIGDEGLPAEEGRYALYISLACPWASRVNALINLKGLQHVIPVLCVEPTWGNLDKREADEPTPTTNPERWQGARGWIFAPSEAECFPGSTLDTLNGAKTLRQLYEIHDPDYSGKYTVPVLWDIKEKKIVNNESSEIFVMINSKFDRLAKHPERNFIPDDLKDQIKEWNDRIYNTVNNGVYRCGFATTQEAYDVAFKELFDMLDVLEEHLSKQRYLCGTKLTESDLRLFVTLIRFDAVYVVHFKTNLRMIDQYPNLAEYTREIYQIPEVKATVDIPQIKTHYFTSHSMNPHSIIPNGPLLDFETEHSRGRFPGTCY